MFKFVEDVQLCVIGGSSVGAVADVEEDSQSHCPDGVLKVGLADGGVVDEDGGTGRVLAHTLLFP